MSRCPGRSACPRPQAGRIVHLDHAPIWPRKRGQRGLTAYAVDSIDAESARLRRAQRTRADAAAVEKRRTTTGPDDILMDLTRRETRASPRLCALSRRDEKSRASTCNPSTGGFQVLRAPDCLPSRRARYSRSGRDISALFAFAGNGRQDHADHRRGNRDLILRPFRRIGPRPIHHIALLTPSYAGELNTVPHAVGACLASGSGSRCAT